LLRFLIRLTAVVRGQFLATWIAAYRLDQPAIWREKPRPAGIGECRELQDQGIACGGTGAWLVCEKKTRTTSPKTQRRAKRERMSGGTTDP